MRYFWYISKTKLDHLVSQQETAFDRLRASLSALIKAEVRIPIGSIGVEMKTSSVEAKQVRILEKVEQRLRKQDLVKPIEDFCIGRPVLFFEFYGPTARLIQDGQFWVATVDSECAILLAGSATNCIGGINPVGNAVSPSVDPLGSVESLLSHDSPSQDLANNLSYIWASVLGDSMRRLGGLSALPCAKGIAISAGFAKSDPTQIRASGYEEQIDRIIVGSPIFVEQAASRQNFPTRV